MTNHMQSEVWLVILTMALDGGKLTLLVILSLSVISEGLQVISDGGDITGKSKLIGKFGLMTYSHAYVYGRASTSDPGVILAIVPATLWNQSRKQFCGNNNKVNSCDHYINNETFYGSISNNCFNYTATNTCIFHLSATMTDYWYMYVINCNNLKQIRVDYQIYVVSENIPPPGTNFPFTYQFLDHDKGLLITFMIFALFYTCITPFHFLSHGKYIIKCKTHLLVWLFNLALVCETINIYLGLIHYSVYASNGIGISAFRYGQDIFNLIGDWFLISVLVLVAGGWMVTLRTIKWKPFSLVLILIYIFLSLLYYVWSIVNPIIYPTMYQYPLHLWAGWIYLGGRSVMLFYVWYRIYDIHQQEETLQKLYLYRVLFGVFTVWFWYLLVVALMTLLNPVIAQVVFINAMNFMNLFVNLVMVALLYPAWSYEYFQFDHKDTTPVSVSMKNLGKLPTYDKLDDE
jgi:hypothetical protein